MTRSAPTALYRRPGRVFDSKARRNPRRSDGLGNRRPQGNRPNWRAHWLLRPDDRPPAPVDDRENPHLPALLDKVAQIPGLSRIRLSSLDPADVTPTLLDVFCTHPNLLPHLHLSLQSGSDAVLRRMARPYTADDFRAKVALIRSHLDRPAITTDIIVGFPGETDADFDQTVALAKEVAFAKMHVFVFSSRKGTRRRPNATQGPRRG